jgi:hypothetical protein
LYASNDVELIAFHNCGLKFYFFSYSFAQMKTKNNSALNERQVTGTANEPASAATIFTNCRVFIWEKPQITAVETEHTHTQSGRW